MNVQGVHKHIGIFDDKEAAARAHDKAAIERGLLDQLTFDDYDLPSDSPAPQRKHISRFRGVSWQKISRKWQVQMMVQHVKKSLRYFDDKEAAARAFDKAAIEGGLLDRLNFDEYNFSSASPATQQEISRFRGVSWQMASRKWRVQLSVQGVQKIVGYFDDEEAVARAYDKAAIKHGLLDRLNFNDHDFPSASHRGVSWCKTSRKLQVQIQVQDEHNPLGHLFEDKEEAAARTYDKAAIKRGLFDRLNFDEHARGSQDCISFTHPTTKAQPILGS
jgi:hypothetical protein